MSKKIVKKCKKNKKSCIKSIINKLGIKNKKYYKLSKKDRKKVDVLYQKIMYKKKYDYISFPTEEYNGKILEKFDTIYDFDIEDYNFQKLYNNKNIRQKYDTLFLRGLPFTALEKNFFGKRDLIFGEIVSAREYILFNVYEKLNDYIENKYPSKNILPYEKRKKNIKNKFKYLETRILEEDKEKKKKINKKIFNNRNKIENYIIKKLVRYEKYTFRISNSSNYVSFIIGGIESAKNIKFKTFFKDFISREYSSIYIENIIDDTFNYFKKYIKN